MRLRCLGCIPNYQSTAMENLLAEQTPWLNTYTIHFNTIVKSGSLKAHYSIEVQLNASLIQFYFSLVPR
jgi:hypothetical protein